MNKITEKQVKTIFIITVTILALILAIIQPINAGPDEKMKMDICKYIANYNNLPHGGDEAVRDPSWGISYGFTPILSYIVGGLFIKVSNIFSQDINVQYIAARMVSVICYSIMAIFVIRIGEKLFKNIYYKWLFILLTTLLPQVIFLASYINNDSLALMSISIIVYSWIIGKESYWNYKSCILLAIGIGLCALSYYNAYGFILTSILFFMIMFLTKKDLKNLIKKGAIVSGIVLALCGWWYVRSYIIYDGDFLGLNITDEYAEKYALEGLKPSDRDTPANTNTNFFDMLIKQKWIKETIKSFIGTFGGMSTILPIYCYIFYGIIFIIGIIGYIITFFKKKRFKEEKKENILFEFVLLFNISIPIILSLCYSYYSDFQPQGRYIMPILIPFTYFVTIGIEKIFNLIKLDYKYIKILQFLIIISICCISLNTLIEIRNSYF